ncbi:beta-glucuronidase, partial [Rhyzopertha dominica]
MYPFLHYLFLLYITSSNAASNGILFPQDSEFRHTLSLNGVWNFLRNVQINQMPVPASYNDITTDPKIRDYLGIVWYDRSFFVPRFWADSGKTWIRFSSVSYAANVYINGKFVVSHKIGHLPFQVEVTEFLNFGGNNRVTVACNNTLTNATVPQGTIAFIETDNGTEPIQKYTFDFFNYAGIDRPVTLFTTPVTYIDDISVLTAIEGTTGIVHYNISHSSDKKAAKLNCSVKLFDKEGNVVTEKKLTGFNGSLRVSNATFWWPYLMDPNPGYLYTLEVSLLYSSTGKIVDVYRLKIGIRTISWTNTSLLINNRPVYLHGFGRHEDSDIRGKGLDLPTVLRDYNLIRWVGANAYRTSHYPYADEIMDLADQYGIMIIDECPSVNTKGFSNQLLLNHKASLTQLINRDKNRPSVVAWSIANEPKSDQSGAGEYFKKIVQHVKNLDTTRPTTLAIFVDSPEKDAAAQYLDIISFNKYNGWYVNPGHLETINVGVIKEATAWHQKHNKPVLISEYGGDSLAGMHFLPSSIWSEDYQVALMSEHFKAFDKLRKEGFFIGEFVWNFADFKTAQDIRRAGGNKKGIFTRNREPKASAYHLRRRYWSLAHQTYNATLPTDLYTYTTSNVPSHEEFLH